MALPRPTLLAIAGALLSLMSFTAMRTIAAQTGGDLPVPETSSQSVAGGPSTPAKPANAAKPAPPPVPKLQDVPPRVANALAGGKVVVLLFAEKHAADDVAMSKHFGALSELGGKVRTFRAGLSDVGRYAGIVAEMGLSQAPAVVIVRPDLRALPPIEGYLDSQYLVQRVRDQLK
ncbi:MAG: hypothetical protein QOJ22_25 [Thermoleophilaceae bacterium]|jgi:hypothetical protein|nr:hypothetical protein [Thermoleophilaceae bacterium]